jgi:hypothetical protein
VVQGGVELCLRPGEVVADAAVDAVPGGPVDGPAGDVDGDGVPDPQDNCANLANPLQANEDGDRFGDVCDPCPPFAGDTPLDGDGDGLQDECDPSPLTADTILLFEGFNAGVPAGWVTTGTWTAVTGAVQVAVAGEQIARIGPPLVADRRSTIATGFVATTVPTNGLRHFGAARESAAEGALCGLLASSISIPTTC